jgi:16S rRNA (guanine966-N2)-methyltransferase
VSEIRIVAGQYRGRRIQVPSVGVRPTADRVKEAWMSIIQSQIPDAKCVDLCAGSGALGLELLSRGAEHCDFVEKDGATFKVLQANVATLGATERATLHKSSAEQFLSSLTSQVSSPPFHLAVADPPYSKGIAETLVTLWLQAPFATIFCIEHEAALTLPDSTAPVSTDRRRYGETALTIYRLTT